MVPEERITPTQMKKSDIRQWLTDNNIHWEQHWLKPRLAETMEQHTDLTPLVQKEAQKKGHRLLILPAHHPELNPTEIVWAIVKNNCAKKLRNGISFKDVLRHLRDALDNEISEGTARKLYRHVREKEEKFWKFDTELDSIDEPVRFLQTKSNCYSYSRTYAGKFSAGFVQRYIFEPSMLSIAIVEKIKSLTCCGSRPASINQICCECIEHNILTTQLAEQVLYHFSLYRTKNGDTLILLKAAAPAKII